MDQIMKEVLQEAYRDFIKYFLTVEAYAEHNGLTIKQAQKLIELAREVSINPQTMKPFIYGKFHAWESNSKILLSNEETKHLREFASLDDCINFLFLNGDKEAARALNLHKKQK